MKKFFAAMILAVTLLLCQNPAQAVDVRLCDCSVETVIGNLNRVAAELNKSVWGKEYYTYKGARRCELHFGNSVENTDSFPPQQRRHHRPRSRDGLGDKFVEFADSLLIWSSRRGYSGNHLVLQRRERIRSGSFGE